MPETGMNDQTSRKAFRAKRNLLFARFSKNPWKIHLALEIKSMDDQFAESAIFQQTTQSPVERPDTK
jgi:hypothetical protein